MNKNLVLLSSLFILALAIISYKVAFAFFSDSASSTGNVFSAASFFPSPSPTASASVEPFADDVTGVTGTFGHCCDASNLSSDPNIAKPLVTGAPDSPPNSNFIQISDNSSVTLKFVDNKAVDGTGADIRIHIFDTIFPATAKIEVSQDGVTWKDTGNYLDTANVDIDLNPLGLSEAFYVRITDLVDTDDPFPTLGFDLDAVEALNTVVVP
ncbi:hypothetical protein HYS93_02700 [Candidatus Daviesbacteria bacterium]|nr:hypothetical protein [Candidatus Daviesbacteria bacterium]